LSSLVGAGAATITVAQVNNGSSDNCGIKSVKIGALKLDELTFTCSNVGANTVLLTVTDNSDNVSTANAIVTVVDDVLPVIAPVTAIAVNNTTGKCGADLAVTPSATATDNCTVGTPIGTRSDARALSATYPLGRTTITWNVTDANGNRALSVIQTVDVTDAQVPVITTNGNKTANAVLGACSADVAVSATATDNCGVGAPTGVRSFNGAPDGLRLTDAYPVGTTTITWNVTDVNGNPAAPVTQTVTVIDTQRPVITANGNKNFVSDFGQCSAVVAVSATATDNCTLANSPIGVRFFNGSLTSDGLPVTAPYAVGTTIIRWNVSDNAAIPNAALEVVQTVVVRDLQIPVINATVVSIDANTDANACGATVTVTPPTATDNCSVTAPVVGTRSDNLPLTALYPIGSTTITWRVSDIYGNVAVPTTTTVKVKDMVLPTVRTKNITVQLNVGGFATIVAAQVNDGSTDNCAIASYSLDKVSFNCSNVGPNPVTLTVIDIHGNVNSLSAIVTISEPVKPIARALTSVTLQLNSLGNASVVPADLNNGSTDNCAIFSYALDKSTFNCSDVGKTNVVNLTATDTSGNVSDPVQVTVIVQDKLAPVVVTQAYTAILNSFGTVTITAANVNNGSNDNCTSTAQLTYSISKDTFTCDNVGENVITLTVTDRNNNSSQAFVKVNVVDNIAPIVVTKPISLVLDGDSVSIDPEDVFVSATDACGVDVHSYEVIPNTFDIDDVLAGSVEVTVYATDVNGNVGSATALVTFPVDPTDVVEAITPNGDGINDTWVVSNITNHPNSVVRVYNRWGSQVFSAKNYQNDWDGKVNGSDATLPDGHAYFYQVDIDGDGKVDSQGWLYITRQK
ncbi:MAG: gliding motility-associated C-terminal domain-containing protein, partial [Bacteroidia bacterium]